MVSRLGITQVAWRLLLLPIVGATAFLGGCTQLRVGNTKLPFAPPHMSADSVAVDVFFVRVPFPDPVIQELWDEVDEQVVPTDTRKELYRNGFRAGRITGPISQRVADLLHVTDDPSVQMTIETTRPIEAFEETPPVRRHLQVRPGHRTELLASGVYDHFPLLRRNENGQIIGQTLERAQGIFAMTVYPCPDGSVRMELIPEVHFGEPRVQPVGSDGVIRWEMRRNRIVLNDLAVKVDLSPGDMIVLTCTSDQPGSLGGRFFTAESNGKREQKLIAIRLSQVQANPPFQRTASTTAWLPSQAGSFQR